MPRITLSDDERSELQAILADPARSRLHRRARIVLWSSEGVTGVTIARRLSISRQAVCNWSRWYRKREHLPFGERFVEGPKPGPPKKYADIDEVVAGAVRSKPSDLGYPGSTWNVRLLNQYLRIRKRISVSDATLNRSLNRLGIPRKRGRPRRTEISA
jgi:transposase